MNANKLESRIRKKINKKQGVGEQNILLKAVSVMEHDLIGVMNVLMLDDYYVTYQMIGENTFDIMVEWENLM